MERLTVREFRLGFDDSNKLLSYEAIYERLRKYENLEEQNRLLKLPCAVGTPVYYIQGNCDGVPKELMFADRTFFSLDMLSKVGREFFLTKEQAEAIP